MSELQLSQALVSEVQQLLTRHDKTAEDPGVTSQYLCAIVGFLLGQQAMPAERKKEVLDQLTAFMQHVADDVDRQRRKTPPPPPPQEAFGIWRPSKS